MKRTLPFLLGAILMGCGSVAPTVASAGDEVYDSDDGKADGVTECTLAARKPAVSVWITPQATDAPMAAVVAKAKKSVQVMVYILDEGAILDALTERAKAGVSEQLILDKSEQATNQAAFDSLTALGAKVIWSDPQFPFMHAKFLVVDGDEAIVATGNFSGKLIAEERNIFAHDVDPKDVGDLVALFNADFARKAPSIACTRLVISPINSKDRIVTLIESAKKTLTVESMQFADPDVRAAVVARNKAGVDVRVLIADPSWIATNTAAAKYLSDNGIEARRMIAPKVHIKNIVVDGTSTYMGSENLSATSLTENRETGLILSNASAVMPIAESFESDWATATAFAE